MALPAIVGALGPSVIAGLGGLLAGRGQATANRQTRRLVREQMAFQERMSGTSYQRAVADMRLAGINPMLAYQQGGASTPGGASAEMKSTLGPAVSSAVSVRRMTAEIGQIGASTRKLEAETDAIRGRPGRILTPAVDVGVDLSRRIFDGLRSGGSVMPSGYPSLSELVRATSARAVQGFRDVAATIGRLRSRSRR